MARHTLPFPATAAGRRALVRRGDEAAHTALNAEDGTLHLLRCGFCVAGLAVLCLALTHTVFGGIGPAGPHSVAGWLCIMIALMCMPFGLLLLLLGGAKWLRNRGLSRVPQRAPGSEPSSTRG